MRFGVSMPKELIEQFDTMLVQQGYDNRSEAIRDLARKALIAPNRLQLHDAVAGTVVIVYDHHASGLASYLMDIQHNFHHEIVSTMHIHLNHEQCLEIIVVRGKWEKLKQLHLEIQVQKGVSYAELSVTHVDEHKAHAHT